MIRYFLHLAYHGTNYRGWQRQPNAVSVQETLETAVKKMTGEQVALIGCGRTDAGVHAERYFAHIDLVEAPEYNVVERFNRILPSDISVFDFVEMPARAHTQYDAYERSYTYRMHSTKNPFLRDLSSYYPLKELDIEAMTTAVSLLPQYSDYRAFCKSPNSYPHTNCQLKSATFICDENREFGTFHITSNRFLRGMIRLLVGNIVLIGKGKMSVQEFEKHLRTGEAPQFYTAAYPQGLYLSDVKYNYPELAECSHKSVFPLLLF